MAAILLSPALLVVAVVSALLGLGFAVASWRAMRHGRVLSFSARGLTTLLFAALGAVCFGLLGATQGYRALTREEIACEVRVEPTFLPLSSAGVLMPDSGLVTTPMVVS